MEVASRGYAAALTAAPDDPVVALRAYREAMAAGDYVLAGRALDVLQRAGVAPADSAVFAFARAVQTKDRAGMDAAVVRIADGPLAFLAPALRGWVLQSRGEDPTALMDAPDGSALARRYTAEHQALLLIARGKTGEGLAALRALLSGADENVDLRINAASLLTGKGRRREARELLAGFADPELAARRLGKGARPTLRFGASRLFTRVAADLERQDAATMSIVLTRSALLLDPEADRARVLLGEALVRAQAFDAALTAFAGVRREGFYGADAQAQQVAALEAAGRADEALARAKVLAEAPGAGSAVIQAYGDLLADRARYAEAATVYARAAERGGGKADWVLQLQQGSALERAGRWDEALPLLRQAVELAPDQAVALNYLGYAQAERGHNLDEAAELIRRALKLAPTSGAISDSLGWVYVQQGRLADALPLLERAAKAEPGDPTINEHLGDVYWRLGRRYEARYAWRAARIYAEADAVSRIDGKLAEGLKAGS